MLDAGGRLANRPDRVMCRELEPSSVESAAPRSEPRGESTMEFGLLLGGRRPWRAIGSKPRLGGGDDLGERLVEARGRDRRRDGRTLDRLAKCRAACRGQVVEIDLDDPCIECLGERSPVGEPALDRRGRLAIAQRLASRDRDQQRRRGGLAQFREHRPRAAIRRRGGIADDHERRRSRGRLAETASRSMPVFAACEQTEVLDREPEFRRPSARRHGELEPCDRRRTDRSRGE